MTSKGSVVITGASTGIGSACAHYLAERGFHVFAGVRKQADADRLLREATSNQSLVPLFIDVAEDESIAKAAVTLGQEVGDGGLTGLVNNAGVVVGGPLELVPIDRLREQLEVNLIGQVAVTQAFLPHLRRTKGRVVNVGSISGRIASPMMGPYSMSKFGLEAFSDSLRRELYPWGIHVSIVEPGAIATPIWEKSLRRAEQAFKGLSEEVKHLYGESFEVGLATAVKMSEQAIPADEVAKVVHRALTATKPRTRYLVGKDAKISARLGWMLPDRAMDWIIRKLRGR
jgi:NAD(P)-dependent dehydrogenase (short-subunit alcohol dehydrogenase family)